MKTIVFSLAILFFILSPIQLLAQQDVQVYHSLKLREIFAPLHRQHPARDFLYEMSVHRVDTNLISPYFDTSPNDTMNAHTWLEQYKEVRYMAYDTLPLQPALELGQDALDYFKDNKAIPLGVIHTLFYRFKNDALTTPNYFNFDIGNNKLIDKAGRPEEPYLENEMFSTSGLAYQLKDNKATFSINSNWIISDQYTDVYYTTSGHKFRIDFGDGNGPQLYPTNIAQHIEITYPTAGEKIVKVELLPDGQPTPVGSNYFRIRANDPSYDDITGSSFTRNGIKVTKYDPCAASGPPQSRKIAVVVEGFDFAEDTDSKDVYRMIISNTQVDELRKFGYEFHVIDWNNSKRDMRENAQFLIDYMDELKCELLDNGGSKEPMVVIGHSMGGIIARYALTRWEKIPNLSSCYLSHFHFTRLLITLDSPHQGANIPLAYQHFYRNLKWLLRFNLLSGMSFIQDGGIAPGLLDSTASKQLLMYHVNTKSGSFPASYSAHQERDGFMNDLQSLGNYPEYAKVVESSLGSAQGNKQENIYEQNQRTPGDKFLQVDGIAYARILFKVVPLTYVHLSLKSSNGSNTVYQSFGDLNYWKIRLFFFGIKVVTDKTTNLSILETADIESYDVESGGNLGLNFTGFRPGVKFHSWPNNSLPLVHAFTYSASLAPGVWLAGAEAGIGFLVGLGAFALVQTDGFDFNFVPLRSALDYGGPLDQGTKSPYIEAAPPFTVLPNTPADVIFAIPQSAVALSYQGNIEHIKPYNPVLFWDNDLMQIDTIKLRSCSAGGFSRYSYLLNREIGDEKLFLENQHHIFPYADYYVEYDIYVNIPNPAYIYTNFVNSPQWQRGAYSKDSAFIIYDSAHFQSDITGAQSFTGRNNSHGFAHGPPQNPNYTTADATFPICCAPQPRLKFLEEPLRNDKAKWLGSRYSHQWVLIEGVSEPIHFELFTIQGVKINEGILNKEAINKYSLTSPRTAGVFILRLNLENEVQTLKIIEP